MKRRTRTTCGGIYQSELLGQRARNAVDLVNRREGRLLVIERARYEHGQQYWTCLCDCGRTCTRATTSFSTSARKLRAGPFACPDCMQRMATERRREKRKHVEG